jgi:O-antigen biosynthesis protein WbqP
MTINTPNVPTNALEDPMLYVTRVGRILRKTSLDELPQLINILKNEMSLIGPRPVIPIETKLIDRRKSLGADKILPGVTGYAQVNGRDKLGYIEKSDYDLYYMNHMSLMFDIRIIITTCFKIVKSEHITH